MKKKEKWPRSVQRFLKKLEKHRGEFIITLFGSIRQPDDSCQCPMETVALCPSGQWVKAAAMLGISRIWRDRVVAAADSRSFELAMALRPLRRAMKKAVGL